MVNHTLFWIGIFVSLASVFVLEGSLDLGGIILGGIIIIGAFLIIAGILTGSGKSKPVNRVLQFGFVLGGIAVYLIGVFVYDFHFLLEAVGPILIIFGAYGTNLLSKK